VTPALLALFLLVPAQPACEDFARCRALALDAQERKDYEAFHDLAWAAYRKGRSTDPEVMLLVARAQSLSGRPGDALVMLERIAALGGATDAVTSEDFARVRALPRWPEVAEKLSAAPTARAPAAPAKEPPPPAKEPSPPAKEPGPPAKEPSPPAKEPAPAAKEPASSAKKPAPSKKDPSPREKEPELPPKEPSPPAKKPKPSAKESLSFTTVLKPTALAYDAVSRRFIIADRQARRIAVVDEHTGQVATLVGEQGALGEIGGMAIDPRQGELWVVTADADGSVLHRMQLISGRVLSTTPLPELTDPVVALTFAGRAGLVAADSTGTLRHIRPTGRSERIAALEYIPRALAADRSGRLYVAGGGPRIARFTLGASLRKIDVVELDPGLPPDAPFTVASGRLHFVVPVEGVFEIRSMGIK
jgi:outer membrane biosynthesis protein TonB